MVCEKCEKKLSKVIVPDKWKEGASNTTEGGGRKINENKLLSKKNRFVLMAAWYETLSGANFKTVPTCGLVYHRFLYSISGYSVYGPLTETLSAPFASSKCTRMLSTATPVLTLKEFVQCVASKFLIPSFTSKAMCNGYSCCIGCRVFF
ncbi:Cysteine-rich PDZ-binding protein [Glycine max]|nr:Cysteine-rich PDZ-binding protein [Glycine max]